MTRYLISGKFASKSPNWFPKVPLFIQSGNAHFYKAPKTQENVLLRLEREAWKCMQAAFPAIFCPSFCDAKLTP